MFAVGTGIPETRWEMGKGDAESGDEGRTDKRLLIWSRTVTP